MREPVPSVARSSPRRVLIVDDNAELVDTLRAVLASGLGAPLEVVTAATGREALSMARERAFDVAIVDVKLPDASGVDLISPLRSACPFGEVLLLTGYASVDAAIGAIRSGAYAFVLKSFRPEELLANVEQALSKGELRREREELSRLYRDLVEATDVLVVGIDRYGRVALINRKAAALVGLVPDQAVGRPLLESWIPSGDHAAMTAALDATRAGQPGGAVEVETGFRDREWAPNEPRRRVRWHLSKAEGEQAPVYGVGIDVTERRALERRAADAEALSAMGTLAMNLAHEIRNPLNAAVLQLHLLDRNLGRLEADAAIRESLKGRVHIVGEEIARLNRLLTEFLELARPRGIAREAVQIAKLVEDVLDLQEETATSRGVAIARDIVHEGSLALGDHEKLKQVVLNLVVNALDAMRGGGTLTVHVRPERDRVLLVVEDTGAGIEPEHLESIFDPFFTTKEAGTGLGLSIVRKIVDQHAGEVQIDSRPGRGTSVVVAIPTGR